MRHPFPLRTVKPAGRYGLRVHPDHATQQFHHGVDYTVPDGSPVHAIATGHVVAVRVDALLGNVVEIDHGAGYRSRYAHLSAVRTEVGDLVTVATVIALSGHTGTAARGPHLHLEVWHHGAHIDPTKILEE